MYEDCATTTTTTTTLLNRKLKKMLISTQCMSFSGKAPFTQLSHFIRPLLTSKCGSECESVSCSAKIQSTKLHH